MPAASCSSLLSPIRSLCLSALCLLMLLSASPAGAAEDAAAYKELEWTDLIPEADLQALLNPPSWMMDIEDGSDADDVTLLSEEREPNEQEARFLQALKSGEVKPELDNQRVRVPGFIVPLAFDDRMRTIEFFLVPYFGACLHLPPPPPNQIIHVNYELGIEMNALYEPYWVEGVLKTVNVSNEVADSAYRISEARIQLYEYD